MGRHGRARIENGMGWPTQAAGYVAAYDRLVGRNPSADDRRTPRPSGPFPRPGAAISKGCDTKWIF